jgi:lysophospholipase L1-like esterase
MMMSLAGPWGGLVSSRPRGCEIDIDIAGKEVHEMRRSIRRTLAHRLALTVLALASGRAAEAAQVDYIAVGDSLAFGEYRFQSNPSNGDHRGYVGPFADALAGLNGGVRPNVIDLGVDGETSTTFFNGGPLGTGPDVGKPAYSLNTNYPAPYPTQSNLLLTTIASQQAAGNRIGDVTIQLGANDLFALALDPTFLAKSAAEQFAIVQSTLGAIQTNVAALITELEKAAPGAKLFVLGYYNPFAPFASDPTSPFFTTAQLSGLAIPLLNQVLAGDAQALGASFVDLYTPFQGHELAYTDVANPAIPGNVHPNPAGYAVITAQLDAAVPEPASLGMMAVGVLALLGCDRRLRARAL